MRPLITTFIFILLSKFCYGQIIGYERIDDSMVSPWIPKLTLEYQCVYHFGDSEIESDFILLFGLGNYSGQIKSGSFSEDGKSFIWTYKNLTNIRIDGNKFYSDQTNGEFVIYKSGQETIKGLKVYNPWTELVDSDLYEIGTKSYPISDYFDGKFTQASKRLLSKKELNNFSKLELRIMRNEIFARYGYKFIEGGEMHKYFKNQEWYSEQYENVNDFLTDLEKENITLILQIEKQ